MNAVDVPILPEAKHECFGQTRELGYTRTVSVCTTPDQHGELGDEHKDMKLYVCFVCMRGFGVWA